MTAPATNGATPDLVIHRAQRRVVGHVTVDGERYAVRSPPGDIFARIQERVRITRVTEIWDIVAALVPELPEVIMRGLTLEDLNDVIGYAMNPVRTVEARASAELAKLHPKVEAAADSLQPTLSATSAPASPSPLGAPTGES